MEGSGCAPEIHDWELLHTSSDSESSPECPESYRDRLPPQDTDDGVIRSDYFSLDSHHKYHDAPPLSASVGVTVIPAPTEDDVSVESDNPSWIDPAGCETQHHRISSEFWSDSSSDPSDSIPSKLPDVNSLESGFADNIDMMNSKFSDCFREVEGADHHHQTQSSSKYWSDSGNHPVGSNAELDFSGIFEHNEVEAGERGQVGAYVAKIWTDSARIQHSPRSLSEREEICAASKGSRTEERDGSGDSALQLGGESSDSSSKLIIEEGVTSSRKNQEDKCRVVWWKVPLEILRYCVFGVSPLWSFSVAAAVMGFVLLGRRLYKMKRKTQGIHLKVTIDDKKVSHFMNRAARLNEAFSVVKRVPVIRPSLPAPGVAPWPVMTLR